MTIAIFSEALEAFLEFENPVDLLSQDFSKAKVAMGQYKTQKSAKMSNFDQNGPKIYPN